ncbi:MAG: aminoacetone oxidase family FAD-binding enzyme [Mogibacterium sp.]|nr:aminoacetone oxidase family FAD-binding enzyme [Mogibacterium sp.]
MTGQEYDTIIIGGGASGMMLAAALELKGRRGIILEKTGSLGTKLLMSGGGRCNITHGGSIKDFIGAYGDAGPRLRKCLYRHNNIELASWLEEHGIALADEKGTDITSDSLEDAGRVFPASMRAGDILALLQSEARNNGWEIRTESEVHDLRRDEDDTHWIVSAAPAERYRADNVVFATGGITFPETGSDGSALDLLREIGVGITGRRSALAPVYVRDYPYEGLAGISLSGVTVAANGSDETETHRGKAVRMTGDLLFTHRGFSGPVVLNISRYTEPGSLIRIRYNREFGDLPKRMQKVLETRAKGPSGDVRTTVLASLLDSDDFTVTAVDDNGMVTAGGISLAEIDPSTMQLRAYPGIYAVGEAIDADGITGGYNLQLCWSTARTAAESIEGSIH